jgi:8-oxo-dGTP diphosphatase
VHVASGSGDDALAVLASGPAALDTLTGLAGELTAVVTADRGLRDRLPETVLRLSPSTVLDWLD